MLVVLLSPSFKLKLEAVARSIAFSGAGMQTRCICRQGYASLDALEEAKRRENVSDNLETLTLSKLSSFTLPRISFLLRCAVVLSLLV